jgi:hypothetical protein
LLGGAQRRLFLNEWEQLATVKRRAPAQPHFGCINSMRVACPLAGDALRAA